MQAKAIQATLSAQTERYNPAYVLDSKALYL